MSDKWKGLPPSGFQDFLPEAAHGRERMISRALESAKAAGFSGMSTPTLENREDLLGKGGQEAAHLTFQVLKRGGQLEEAQSRGLPLADLALRFDLTVPLMRYWVRHQHALPKIFRRVQVGPVFRAERAGAARWREFLQFDLDILGPARSPDGEVALLSCAIDILNGMGLQGAYTIRWNHVDLLKGMLAQRGLPSSGPQYSAACRWLDKLDKIGEEKVREGLRQSFPEADLDLLFLDLNSDPRHSNLPQTPALVQWLALEAKWEGVKFQCSPSLVRGLEYYTGLVFEITHPDLGVSIGGGGRYDGLLGSMTKGAQQVQAVGMSLGLDRLWALPQVQAAHAARDQKKVMVFGPCPEPFFASARGLFGAAIRPLSEAALSDREEALLEAVDAGCSHLLWQEGFPRGWVLRDLWQRKEECGAPGSLAGFEDWLTDAQKSML